MRRRYRANLIKAVTGVILSSILLTVTVAAWFLFLNKSSDPVDLASGNIDMEVWFFTGNDFNEDGNLEKISYTYPEGIAAPTYLANSICAETYDYYNYQPSNKLMRFTNLTEGSTITYRCAVINRNDYGINISMWFYNLEDYFDRAVDEYIEDSNANSDWYINNYSARIMFKIENVKARQYSFETDEAKPERASGIDTTAEAVNRMKYYNTTSTDLQSESTIPEYLFALSNEQPFIGVNKPAVGGEDNTPLILAGNSMCVIDFKMVCASKSEVIGEYYEHCTALKGDSEAAGLTQAQKAVIIAKNAAIDAVCENELKNVGGGMSEEGSGTILYSFTIPVIYVKGVQVEDEAQTVSVGETTNLGG